MNCGSQSHLTNSPISSSILSRKVIQSIDQLERSQVNGSHMGQRDVGWAVSGMPKGPSIIVDRFGAFPSRLLVTDNDRCGESRAYHQKEGEKQHSRER